MDAYGRLNEVREFPVEAAQMLVSIRCSDARDATSIETEVTNSMRIEYAARGVEVNLQRVNLAGSVVNSHSVGEVIQLIVDGVDHYVERFNSALTYSEAGPAGGVLFVPVVQITGHADVTVVNPDPHGISQNVENVRVADPHSPVNCGMSHASDAWSAVRKWLVENKITARFYDRSLRDHVSITLNSDEDIMRLMNNAYTFRGQNIEEFLYSIDLIHQPLRSKAFLREKLDHNVRLSCVPVHINASILHYGTGREVRIDGNQHIHTFLDDVAGVTAYVIERLPDNHPERAARTIKQKPVCGLICPPLHDSRDLIMNYLSEMNPNVGNNVAGSVFLTTGADVVVPYSTFGRYKLGGIAYSIMSLGLKDYYLIGRNKGECHLMEMKLKNDPILSVLFEKFEVKVHMVELDDVRKKANRKAVGSLDEQCLELINEGIRKFPRHERSALNRPVVAPRVRELLRGF